MATQSTNWYRNDIPEKTKNLEKAEREYVMATLALKKAEAELNYCKAQLEHYQTMADLTDEDNRQMEEQRQEWAKQTKTPLKEIA